MNSSTNEKEDAIVLRTKLHRPPIPPDFVPRPRLADILEAGRTLPLTLVSAPAGYGKSVLVSSWLQGSEWPSAWLSLDTDDGDIRLFLRYFVAAVRTVRADACKHSGNLLSAVDLPPTVTVATILANDLDNIEQPFLLALDDYHRINASSPVHDLLAQLLTHPPLRLHLVISTRRDPPLPLVVLRARGQLNDIRMHDLLFESTEARVLLQKAAAFTPNDEALAILDKEIEGWSVGLRLVSLTAQRAADPNAYLIGLNGGPEQTLAIASAGGWIRPFIEPGRDMERLLRRLAEQRGPSAHLQLTLEAFQARRQPAAAVGPDIAKAETTSTREPLTRRERDILKLLAQRMQNKEIAPALFVSPETVKSHLKNLYQKLEVTNRRDAAAKAMEILAAMENKLGLPVGHEERPE